MKERTRSHGGSPTQRKLDERMHRFLRPGALARLRDTRMNTASRAAQRPASASLGGGRLLRLSPPSSPSPPAVPAQVPAVDGVPCFLAGSRGPRCPQRKKLLAAKAVFWAPASPVRVAEPAASPLLDVFDADLLLAH